MENEIEVLAECVLNRMDTRGESIDEAIEAVTGGCTPEIAAKIAHALGVGKL